MRDLFKALSFTAALAVATTAVAQDTPAEPAAEAGAGTGEPEIGQVYNKEKTGDWDILCVRAPIGQTDPCQMSQLLKDEGGNPVSEFKISALPAGGEAAALARILTPLETFLPPGVEITIDGKGAGRVPFLFCNKEQCVSEFTLKTADVGAFKSGGVSTLTIVPAVAPEQKVVLNASLKGFTAAFNSLVASLPKPE